MFTREELRAVPVFAHLGDKELNYLIGVSADIHLRPGEYAIHEGEAQRALFVLLAGQVEVTKFIDGAERVVGTQRSAGEVFGEVPAVLNTPSLVSFRALHDSRVMRIDAKDFHIVATSAPKFGALVEAAALERVAGLQEIAALPVEPHLTVIGPQWDNATHELREFLYRNSIEHDWLRPDDSSGDYPVARLPDGTLLSNPSVRDIARAVGLSVSPRGEMYDVAIVGGGPAGLAAAVYGASEGLSTVLVEREAPGGQAGTSSRIENYLGFPFGISGEELATRALRQALRLGAQVVVTRTIGKIAVASRTLILDGGESVHSKTIILATGVSWRQLEIPSLDRLRGRGVFYGAAPGEAKSVQGKDIYLIGGGNSAGQAAINFSNFAKSATLLVRGDSLAKSMSHYLIEQLDAKSNVRVEIHAEVIDAYGKDHLESIVVANRATGETTRRPAFAMFVLIGADAETAWLPAGIDRDARGYVLTGGGVPKSAWKLERDPFLLETSVPGIFAVGDVRAGSVKRVAAAVGEGSMAVALAHQYLAYAAQSHVSAVT
jgi:thioredoxin reductase (NADPH)